MGCIYNGVCSSLVALFSWHQVTHLAAVMAHWYFKIGFVFEFFVDLCNLREICLSNMVTLGRRLGSAAQFPPQFVGSVHIACLLLRAMSAYGGLSQ